MLWWPFQVTNQAVQCKKEEFLPSRGLRPIFGPIQPYIYQERLRSTSSLKLLGSHTTCDSFDTFNSFQMNQVVRSLVGLPRRGSLRVNSPNGVRRHFFFGWKLTPALGDENVMLWCGDKKNSDGAVFVDDGEEEPVIKQWSMFNDNDYGGKSNLDMQVLTENVKAERADGAVEKSFMRLSGFINLDETLKNSLKVVGGFCAIKGNSPSSVDLRDCEGLELIVRSSIKQTFTFNMGTTSLFDDDMYQMKIELEPSEHWKTLKIPFSMFRLTARGLERETQRANDSLQLESLGFLFKEDSQIDQDVGFSLDVLSIEAKAEI